MLAGQLNGRPPNMLAASFHVACDSGLVRLAVNCLFELAQILWIEIGRVNDCCL